MSKEEVLCAALDNTSVRKSEENVLENSNTTRSVEEPFLEPVGNNAEADLMSKNAKSELTFVDTLDQDENEFDVDAMTGSYGEISLEQEISAVRDDVSPENRDSQSSKETEDEKLPSAEGRDPNSGDVDCSSPQKESRRPNSLILLKNSVIPSPQESTDLKCDIARESDDSWRRVNKSQQTSDSQTTSIDGSPSLSSEECALYSSGHRRTGSDTSGLSELQGTLTVDGDMVTFVADDLQEKIKMSSPVSRWADCSFPGSRSSTPSLYRQALQPHIPLVDAGAVADLEVHAKKVATCVDTMLENLSGTLQSISSLTVDYMETYESSVCKTCDAVDQNIKAMYQLMAKCEELSNSMRPLYRIAEDIKEIKKFLAHLENALEHKT